MNVPAYIVVCSYCLGNVADDLITCIAVRLKVTDYREIVERLVYTLKVLVILSAADDDASIGKSLIQESLIDPGNECPEDITSADMKSDRCSSSGFDAGVDIVLR